LACGEPEATALVAAGSASGVPFAVVGRFGGAQVTFGRSTAPLENLLAVYRSAFASALG